MAAAYHHWRKRANRHPLIRDNRQYPGIGPRPPGLRPVQLPHLPLGSVKIGLGMAAVHGIVKNHGGWTSVDSVAGKGTTVNVFFPESCELSGARPKLT